MQSRLPKRIEIENLDVKTNIRDLTKRKVIYELYKAGMKNPYGITLERANKAYNELLTGGIIKEYKPSLPPHPFGDE